MSRPIFIPLAAGVQTELAEQLVDPGATLVQENVYCPETGKARVRFGADVLSTDVQATIPSGGTLPLPWQLATLGGQLVRFGRAPIPIHTWAPGPEAWVVPSGDGGTETQRKGPIKVDTSATFTGTAQASDGDVAVSADAIVHAYRVDTGLIGTTGVTVSILDRATRRAIITKRGGGGSLTPHVVIVGTNAIVAYESGGFLQVDRYSLVTYTRAESVALGAIKNASPIDMRVEGPVSGSTKVHILYLETGGELRCAVVDSTAVSSNSTFKPRTTASAAVSPDLAFGWMQDFGGSAKFAIMIADTTNGLRVLWDLPAPTAGNSDAVGTHTLDAAATAAPSGSTRGIRNVIGTTVTGSSTGVYRVLYEMTATNMKTAAEIRIAVWNGSASIGVQFRSVGLRSKFWNHAGSAYFLAAFDGQDQRSYFVLSMAEDTVVASTTFYAPLAIALARDAGGLTENVSSPSAAAVGPDGEIFIAVTEETRTEELVAASATGTGVVTRLLGADLVRVRHVATVETELGKPAEFIKSLFTPGGLLGFFDTATYGTAGFAYYPPNLSAGAAAQSGGSLEASATYGYRFVFAFMDRPGRIWRSAPSVLLESDTSGTNKQFLVSFDTYRLPDRFLASGATGYWIEVYRTQADAPGAHFLVAVVPNDPTVHTLSFTDNCADADVGEELYTDGGGVENQVLPPIVTCVEYQGRLMCAEQGTGTLWYSLEADFTSGLIFNEALTLDVGDPSDPITGLAVFNDTLFVFKSGKIYTVGGQGANALGQGATYTARLIDPSVGCENPQSIAVADDGVWFKSSSARAGIHRTNGGVAEYVGAGVRAYDTQTITSAVVVRESTEIRFYALEGITLCWNWTAKTWGWNTAQTCLTATIGYHGVPGVVYARADGYVLSEATADSLDPYTEGGAPYLARIRTPWYRLGGQQSGWGRVRRIQGVGQLPANHRTVVSLYKNQELIPFQTASIVFGETRPRWDWEIRPEQQPMSSVLIEVTIYPYQPPAISITPGDDSYEGVDPESGFGLWEFANASFSPSYVGYPLTIVGGPYAGTYTIEGYVSGTEVLLSPLPSAPAVPTLGRIFDVDGSIGIEESSPGVLNAWRDQAGQLQDLNETDPGKEPLTGVDTINGVPCVSFPLDGTTHANIRRDATMKDRNGNDLTPGHARTVMAMIKPKTTSTGIGFNVTGGPVFSFRESPMFECLFDLESFFHVDGFYVFANNWRFGGGEVRGPDTAEGTYANRALLAEWRSSGTPALAVAVNGGADLTLTGPNPEQTSARPDGFVLGNCDNLSTLDQINFIGAIAKVVVWDWDLSTDTEALATARAHFALRFPAAGITPPPVGATQIYITPPLQYTAGPAMVGVSLLPVSKDGMDKLPASRRLT